MSLGKRLKSEREKRKWSQMYVAKRIGITNTVLSNYERDYRDPDTDTLTKLADLYEVAVDYLLGRAENPTASSNSSNLEKKLTDEEEFQAFANDPELERWYRELPESEEEDLQALRQMWEIIKKNKK